MISTNSFALTIFPPSISMGRKKSAKKAGPAQQSKNLTQMKPNAAQNKNKLSKQVAEQFKKMNASPLRTRKQMRERLQENLEQAGSTCVTLNNDRQPSRARTARSKEQKKTRRSTAETIVIEDSDEENNSNRSGEASPKPLFYLDRKPGIREAEVPLYNVCHEIDYSSATSADRRPSIDPNESSVVVLDSTIDQTMNDSMKEMQIDPKTVPAPSSTDSSATATAATSQSSSSSSSSNINTNIPIETESKQATSASPSTTTNVEEVIDLSDYSDSEPILANQVSSSTPAFPALDCIPLGFDVLQLPPNRNGSHQKPTKKSRWDKRPGMPNKTQPVPAAKQQHAEEIETKKRMVIIDGNNVAFGHLNGKMFSVKGLDLCIKYFKRLGHEVTAVVPQFRLKKSQSTDYVLLDKLARDGDVTLAPCKNLPGQFSSSYDDRLILSVAEQFDGVIISNDNFRDLLEFSSAWRRIIETRVIGYTWVKDCFFLPDDPYGRFGPTLQQILNGKSA